MSGKMGHGAGGHDLRVRQHYESRHECALSQIATCPDMTVDVAMT